MPHERNALLRERALKDRNRTTMIKKGRVAPTKEKPEGEDMGRVYIVLAKECGLVWPAVLQVEEQVIHIMFEEAMYERRLQSYERSTSLG